MDFMKLIGTVLAVCLHPGGALKGFSSQRICRRGTERPCYKIAYHQDSGYRVSFEEAMRMCREDDGELLSIETESEQRLMEIFLRGAQVTDGDFWIGLRRNQSFKESGAVECSSQYHWLDYSQATYRNWQLKEPSCGFEQCASLYYRPNAHASLRGRYMYKWNDIRCNSKNNFICKYAEIPLVPTPAGNSTVHSDLPAVTLRQLPVTMKDEMMNTGFSESSVSLSDEAINVSYILLATVPVLLLIILLVSGVLCYRIIARKRKEQNDIYAVPGQWVSTNVLKHTSTPVPKEGPSRNGAQLEYMSSEINRILSSGDYENVPSNTAGFVTNAIYETCRTPTTMDAGWVDNDIYGY